MRKPVSSTRPLLPPSRIHKAYATKKGGLPEEHPRKAACLQKLFDKPIVSEFSDILLVTLVPGIGPIEEIHGPVIEF